MQFKHSIAAILVTLMATAAPTLGQVRPNAAPAPDSAADTAIAPPAIAPILQALPQPPDAPRSPDLIFSANSYGQQALNFQINQSAPALLEFYRQALTAQGYQERTINTTSGTWGFSIVFIPPEQLALQATRTTQTPALQIGESITVYDSQDPGVFLVIQAVALSLDQINVNLRFEEL
jgi:hypothetical protein